jgi:hypothetical protein
MITAAGRAGFLITKENTKRKNGNMLTFVCNCRPVVYKRIELD